MSNILKSAATTQIQNRLSRASGQIKGVIHMMETGRDCKEVITQLVAAKASFDKTIKLIIAENIRGYSEVKNTQEQYSQAIKVLLNGK
ncbi:metal-sensing transcriptional repressor [Lactiplantibacillus sp. WILCCON 0030]|uniref:Metal-sensing transcriptional repressor n=1 Tax=Lactiplantibacillus brownii TaxID=3069269 RepID=A0ABU1ADJ3_9LACO|nr:metal-sensing transcriptional repressor [Lactiplantibacillus brownii]MDQ7939053.1 metal-sensing transcriptional repressor [Lactiplantibacillus brownii]